MTKLIRLAKLRGVVDHEDVERGSHCGPGVAGGRAYGGPGIDLVVDRQLADPAPRLE